MAETKEKMVKLENKRTGKIQIIPRSQFDNMHKSTKRQAIPLASGFIFHGEVDDSEPEEVTKARENKQPAKGKNKDEKE